MSFRNDEMEPRNEAMLKCELNTMKSATKLRYTNIIDKTRIQISSQIKIYWVLKSSHCRILTDEGDVGIMINFPANMATTLQKRVLVLL